MWHVGMIVVGAITNSLIYSVDDCCVGMWYGGVILIDVIENRLLFSVVDR
jgi:hypothetical protein